MSGGGTFGRQNVSVAGDRYGYSPNWMAETRETLADELRSRGVEPTADQEMPQVAPRQSAGFRTVVLMRWLLGVLAVGLVAWLIGKMFLG